MSEFEPENKEHQIKKFYHNEPMALKQYLSRLPEGTPIAIEACGYESWLCDVFESHGLNVHLGHPLKTKAIAEAKIKTDKIDSRILAELLAYDLLPEAYLPKDSVRQQRALLRYRQSIARMRTQTKNRIHFLLDRLGIRSPEVSDLFGCKGILWLKQLSLKGHYQSILQGHLEILEFVSQKIHALDKLLFNLLKENPQAELLQSIPGVGRFTAFLLLAEIGPISRFQNEERLCSYSGLIPSVYQSGLKEYRGPITKQGNKFIRWALIEAAHTAIKKDPFLKDFYQRIKVKKGISKALVAVARKLLVSVFHVLTKNQTYRFRTNVSRRSSLHSCPA
jgi:transposase